MSCLDNIKNSDFRGYPTLIFEVDKTEIFKKECAEGYEGSSHEYTRTYSSFISESHLNYLIENDSASFRAAGQAHANSVGTCALTKPTEPNPPLHLQAVDANNFYISGLEPFTRAEFTSSNPLPSKSLRNKLIYGPNHITKFPHLNNNESSMAVLEMNSEEELTGKLLYARYDSSVHPYNAQLNYETTHLRNEAIYSFGDYAYGLEIDRLAFQGGDFVVGNTTSKDEVSKWIRYVLGGLSIVTGFLVFDERGYTRNSGTPYKHFVRWDGYGNYVAGAIALWVLGASLITWAATDNRGYPQPIFNIYWRRHDKEFFSSLADSKPISNDTRNYIPAVQQSLYDSVAKKIYVFMCANKSYQGTPGKRPSYRCFRSIAKFDYDADDLDARPERENDHLPWNNPAYVTGLVIGINTSNRAAFLWVQKESDGGYTSYKWGVQTMRGTAISEPPKAVFDPAAYGLSPRGSRTIQDSTQPHICYISTGDRVVSYNSATNTWAVVRVRNS